MITRKPILGSAACVLFSCAVIVAPAVQAQPYPAAQSQNEAGDVAFAERLLMPSVPVALVRLEDVANVNGELFNIPVFDAAGYRVGHFRRVETKRPGDVVAVITLNGSRRTIAVLTDHVRYDPGTRLIIADLTTHEFDLTPPGSPYG